MLKSRIVAIALISIILSSSSFSVVDGNTVWSIKTTKDLNIESKFYKINLIDNAASSLDKNSIRNPQPYQINLIDDVSVSVINNLYDNNHINQINIFDGILSAVNSGDSKNVYQKYATSFQSEIISINLSDGISSDTTDFGNNDDRIILIKQSSDRKALWERIFPLDRIRNISKSFFKIIQNDYNTSYVQLSEINTNNDENSLERARIYGSELENLSEFEKFVGKADYVYNQIGIRAFDLLDAQKFVGKANFVGIQLAQHAQHLADPKKFIGKSSYVADQIAIRAQHLADPEKFVGKSMFVGQQITIQVYPVVDPHNPTLLILLIPLIGIVLIRNENDRIKFYNIQKIVSFIFVVILISSAIITPFSYSVMYWGYAFAEEDPLGTVGPPEEPGVEQLDETVEDVMEENAEPPPVEEPVLPPESVSVEEPVAEPIIESPPDVPVDVTSSEPNNIIPTRNDLSTTFDENIVLTDNTSNELEQHIETQQTKNNQTISLDETFNLTDIISLNNKTQQNKLSISLDETIVLTDEITSPDIPQNQSESLPEYLSFIDDIVLLLQNQTIPSIPNATESWQFENDTDNADLIGDATIDYTEGINGTSLLLDGQLDYAQTNSTNATTYITDMSIAAWVKPNYTNGSPEFTVVSKGKSFVLSINNIIEPQHVAKFSVFDGIKWTTVESYSTIPDDSWSHITARFNKTSIALYVNGTLEGTVTHGGVPYVTEKGQIELKTLQEITSYQDIVIGASLTPNMESRAFNMFSGMIDGVQLFDSRLEPDDIILLYQTTVPIKAPIPVPEIRRPEPVLRYRIIKGNETLPISIPAEDLDETNQLTISTWIKPNFTGGSPEFTVLSRENSFILSLNKMLSPEKIAKFSVYDGISWHTVTGSTPIGGWTQVAAVVNGSRISIYINGTLDGKLETGPPWIAGSTANVTIGAYENTLRGGAEWSNYYFGEIGEAVVWEYSMVDREMEKEYWKTLLVYQPHDTQKKVISMHDSIKTDEYTGKPNDISIPNNSIETESLSITEDLALKLNGIPIITPQDSLEFFDDLKLTLNQEQQNPVNSTILPQTLAFSDSLYLKLNETTYTYLEEGLLLTEDILLLLNNQTVTFSNSTSRLTHGIIEIGKPVDWTQNVVLNNTEDLSNILVELPADAQNIQIQKTNENGTSTEIPYENLVIISPELEPIENEYDVPFQKDIDLNEIAKDHNAKHVVPLEYATLEDLREIKQKDKPTVALLINETGINANVPDSIIPQNNTQQNQTEYTIQFQTPAPYAIENDYSTSENFQKDIIVTHNSTLHYTDVKSYSNIPEYLIKHHTNFKLHWIINETKVDVTNDPRFAVTFVDADANGFSDRMEWTVPQLSEQQFEIEADITIINIQSYPVVGGNWTVYFNTTGTADLTITGVDGTTFGNLSPDDLKFLELNDGTQTLSPIINLTANTITYYNYSSNETGFEASKVLTDGKHRLMFQFGNDIAFAQNLATDPIEVAVGRFTLNGAPGLQSITGVGFQPKAYILISTPNDFDDTNSADGPSAQTDVSIGMTDGRNSFAMVTGADDRQRDTNLQRRGLEQYVLLHMDNNTAGSLFGAAQHERFDANGFTINIVDDYTTPTSPLVTYIAFGGEGVTPNVGLVDLASPDGSIKKASGLGFEPDLVISSYIGDFNRGRAHAENDVNSFSLGWAINPDIQAANNQFSVMFDNTHAQTTSQTSTRFDTVRAGVATFDSAQDASFEITGFDSDGFTVTTRLLGGSAASTVYPFHTMGFLALDLGDDPEVYTVSRTARTATGNDVANGVGFQPTFLMALGTASATITNANTDTTADADDADFFVGVTNGTYSFVNSYLDEDAVTETVVHTRSTGGTNPNDTFLQALQVSGSSASVNYEADFVSFDADGWTIDYPANPADLAYQIAFLAIGDGYEFYQPPPARFMQPDAGAPGMNLQVQFLGNNFNNTQQVTTNSPDIVVGPTVATDEFGNNVTNNGRVLSTVFFINKTAAPQTVTVSIDGVNIIPTFKIINTATNFAGTGDYSTAAPGTYTLGDDDGRNGNRTKGGTIILDSLIVPNGITLNINVTDIDKPTVPNEGYLPAIILVDGDVRIDGTITVSGQAGSNQADPNAGAGGPGGPGGGGGGGGGVQAGAAGNGGDGFTGGGGGAADTGNGPGGNGGNGVGSTGIPENGDEDGGIGGHTIIGNYTGGIGGQSHSTYGSGGGGGTGFPFGSGAVSGTSDGGEFSSVGSYGGGSGGSVDTDNPGGGGGFGSAGADGVGGNGEGSGGKINGNPQLVPIAGGSGGGGGGQNDDGGTDGTGGGGGGGGALLIYGNSRTFVVENDGNLWSIGGTGGNVDTPAEHGEGGGGSGGAIILQGISVDSSAGEIDVNGGDGPGEGGDGGDGRVRVDGLRRAVTNIEGLVAFSGSEYVGPSVGFNKTHINGTAALNSDITIVVQHSTGGTNYYKFLPVNANREFGQPISFTDGAHYITAIQNTTNTNPVMSSAATHIVFHRTMKDSTSANDDITTIGMILQDDLATVEDIIVKAPANFVLKDTANVNDVLRFTTIRQLTDSVRSDDDITTIGMRLQDDLATVEDIIVKAPANFVLKDTANVNDVLRFTTIRQLTDSVRSDDDITTIGMRLQDDLATVEDIIVKAPANFVLKDTANVNDVLRFTTIRPLTDSATVNDILRPLVLPRLFDSATVQDTLVKVVTYRPKDSALVQDVLRATTIKPLSDSATVDDHITAIQGKLLFDSATVQDTLVKVVTYRPKDSALVQDVLRATTIKSLSDSATVNDTLIVIPGKTLFDSATVNDVLRANIIKVLKDSARVDDTISFTASIVMKDSATVDDIIRPIVLRYINDSSLVGDSLSFYVIIRLSDTVVIEDIISVTGQTDVMVNPDSARVDDSITKTVSYSLQDLVLVNDILRQTDIKVLNDSATVEDLIRVTIIKTLEDSATIQDTLTKVVMYRPIDSVLVQDTITTFVTYSLADSAAVDDNIKIIFGKILSDSATVEDLLSATSIKPLKDSAGADDTITTFVTYSLADSAAVDDNIKIIFGKILSDSATVEDLLSATSIKPLKDSAGADDTITTFVTYSLADSAAVDDNIKIIFGKILSDSATVEDLLSATSIKPLKDSAGADDTITTFVTYSLADSAAVDDNIKIIFGKILSDSATVEDLLSATSIKPLKDSAGADDTITTFVTYSLADSAAVDDILRITITKTLEDSATIQDTLTKVVMYRPIDSVLVQDTITKFVTYGLSDSAAVDDILRITITKTLEDSATIQDTLTKVVMYRPIDSVLVQDTITKFVTYGLSDSAAVDDILRITITKTLEDSATIQDTLTKVVTYRPIDSVLVQDTITKFVTYGLSDSAAVDDILRITITKTLEDSATIQDTLTKVVTYRPIDSVLVQDTITKFVTYGLSDSAAVDDILRITITKTLEDSATIQDTLTKVVTYRPIDSVLVQDTITKFVTYGLSDSAAVDDILRITITKTLEDSATIQDTLTKVVTYRPIDSVLVQDTITKFVTYGLSDSAAVDDILRITITKTLEDSATIQDTLTKVVMYRPIDSVLVQDTITKFVTYGLSDSAAVDDDVFWTLTRVIEDAVIIDDTIRLTLTRVIVDDVIIDDNIRKIVILSLQSSAASKAIIDDVIIKSLIKRKSDEIKIDDNIRTSVTYRISDTISSVDTLASRITKQIKDSASINDRIAWTLTRVIKDESSTVEDILVKAPVTFNTKDTARTDDHITWTLARSVKDTVSVNDILRIMPIKSVKDSAVVNDVIVPIAFYRRAMLDTISDNDYITPMGTLNIETRDDNDNLVPLSNTYRIIPNPFTGIGSLLVTDGDPNDYDGVLDNGQISVFPVPLDTYRINQTISPAGYSSLINFTYTTVHHTDLNATALFRVILDPAELPVLQQKSDILDIANNGFDDLLSSVQLVKVNNGAQVIINYTTDMPAPIFAGANNATAISNAIASQFTLLYNNLVLPPNDSPEDIISKFRQTPYDAGNFTKTTFVGVMAATNQAASRQYLATQPFDKFNCGQEYIYSIDDTLVPTFGGMTGFDMNMSSTGVCPDAQDYLTFEISQVPPAGIPALSGEDILLYVNPQYPNGSITGIGVDFSDSSNIDSFRFTLISPLPETGDKEDLTVYLYNAGWNTAGVTILSKQLLSTGPNAGMIEIIVSVDHLAKMIVGGKQIPPLSAPQPPIISGSGATGVGPGGGTSSLSTAKVHRVEYDVCNENIVRILAAHDSSSPPRIQLLTTKSGVIDATLSSNQPFANQNKITLVDRYLFEAPLSKGESVFTIFAVDYHSNVQRTLVQVDGCQGVLVFADDQIVLPHIFDIKYQTNSTYIRPTDYSYITQGQDMTVSAIVESPIVPLGKAELFFTILGTAEQKVLPMTITPLILPDLENVSVISGIIPANLLKGPAVEYWIRIVTAEGVVQESVHSIVGVKPEGYSDSSSVEMDTITIKAQGTTLKPTTYLTNEGDIPVYGEVSLVSEGKKVYSKPVLLTPGQNIIHLEWKIPKTDQTTSYNIQTQLDVYDKSYITGIATLDTFVRTKIVPMSAQSEIVPATDELGNTIARPAMMYSSNDGTGAFRVTAPDGTCVIGAGCIVEESTLKHHGGIDSVLIDGHIYRVRYSGDDSPLERFSITSLDSVLGEWNVKIVDNSPFTAAAADDVPIKVQYRAERSPMVTVGME